MKRVPYTYRRKKPIKKESTTVVSYRKKRPYTPKGMGVEYKFVDQVVAATGISTTWTGGELDPVGGVNCLGACTQGTGESNRDGSRILVKSIQINGILRRTVDGDEPDARAPTITQISLVMDKQSNGAQLNAEDVYVNTAPRIPALRVVANSHRFKILKTWIIEAHDTCAFTDGANTGSVTRGATAFTCYLKMNQIVNFVAGAGAGTIEDFKDVSFHMIACTLNAITADAITYNCRVRFIG